MKLKEVNSGRIKLDEKNFKEIDFASHAANVTTYAVIVRDQGNMSKILFEPNEKMLECIRAKAPRKIVFE